MMPDHLSNFWQLTKSKYIVKTIKNINNRESSSKTTKTIKTQAINLWDKGRS